MLMNISVTDAALEEAMKAIPPGRRSQFVCDAIRAWIGMTDPDLFDSAVQRGIQYAIEVEGRLADAARRRHCRAAALIESGCDPLEAAARASRELAEVLEPLPKRPRALRRVNGEPAGVSS